MSTCMAHEEGCIWGVGAVRRSREHREGKGRKKREKEIKERMRGKEKRERRRRKGERKKENRKAVFPWSELVRPRSKVHIFNGGYASRGRDSSYLSFFLSFEILFWYAFWTTLCHVYGMFCGINWNMPYLVVSIETVL